MLRRLFLLEYLSVVWLLTFEDDVYFVNLWVLDLTTAAQSMQKTTRR